MKRWVFTYHFPHALVKYANQKVVAEGTKWWVAAAKADREVSKREGIKGKHMSDIFKRSCYPVKTGLEESELPQ